MNFRLSPSALILPNERRHALQQFQKKAHFRFKHLALLELALSHSSFSNEHEKVLENNERLEFLGDAVIGLVITSFLYRQFPDYSEGKLAKIKAIVASEEALAEIGFDLGLDTVLRLGRGEELSGGRKKKALIADALEALLGALYLDSGLNAVTKFISPHFKRFIFLADENKYHCNYKSLLQERLHQLKQGRPEYRLVKQTGPEHQKTFWVEVYINDEFFGKASAGTKKEAEQGAAQNAWYSLEKKHK